MYVELTGEILFPLLLTFIVILSLTSCSSNVNLEEEPDGLIAKQYDLPTDYRDVFLSFQATKTNGSIVTNIDDENNGLWTVNPQKLEKEKICSDVFEWLYLFNGDLLFGIKNNSLYKIDIKTKQIIKISN